MLIRLCLCATGEKTIHANLPPQTGVQLGQSGVESSGVEGADRPRSSRWLRRGDLLRRTMMAAQLSDDGGYCGCYRRPHQQRGLTWPLVTIKKNADAEHVCVRARVGKKGEKHTLCQSQRRTGSTLAAFCPVTWVQPLRLFDPQRTMTTTTHQAQQIQRATSYEVVGEEGKGKNGKLPSPCSSGSICKYGGKGLRSAWKGQEASSDVKCAYGGCWGVRVAPHTHPPQLWSARSPFRGGGRRTTWDERSLQSVDASRLSDFRNSI